MRQPKFKPGTRLFLSNPGVFAGGQRLYEHDIATGAIYRVRKDNGKLLRRVYRSLDSLLNSGQFTEVTPRHLNLPEGF